MVYNEDKIIVDSILNIILKLNRLYANQIFTISTIKLLLKTKLYLGYYFTGNSLNFQICIY